ncbi:hypothetical protein GTQ99_02400 [Kineococcus sp. T13]|uniref:hypothetical protein n=1 Tax=Kineococcus vitellinus TaxID=2696565 RepID=UPI001411BDF5|nr:hypothetical protein [Kineococcus vitellinus]NAZ74279.1 hypothetical protein [Kineococcus vitellinus]
MLGYRRRARALAVGIIAFIMLRLLESTWQSAAGGYQWTVPAAAALWTAVTLRCLYRPQITFSEDDDLVVEQPLWQTVLPPGSLLRAKVDERLLLFTRRQMVLVAAFLPFPALREHRDDPERDEIFQVIEDWHARHPTHRDPFAVKEYRRYRPLLVDLLLCTVGAHALYGFALLGLTP